MLLTTFLFTGCQKNTQIKPKTVFQADFTLLYNEMQIKGEIQSNDDNSVEIEVDSPETLDDLKITAKDGKFKADYNGISKTYTKNDLPNGTFFKLIIVSLEKIINSNEIEFEEVDGKYQATENSPLGDIKITLDNDFYIEKIEIPSHGFNLKLQVKTPS